MFLQIKVLMTVTALLLPSLLFASVITVNTTVDEAGHNPQNCSLREAISAAIQNQAFGGCPAGQNNVVDTIEFSMDGVFALSIHPDNTPNDNLDGDLDISSESGDLMIHGRGRTQTIIDGNGIDRVFEILPAVNAFNADTVMMDHLTIQGGLTDRSGGGIYHHSSGLLDLTNVSILNNQAANGGGAYLGGGVFDKGTFNFVDCHIHENTAAEDGGGLFLNAIALTFQRSTVSNNASIGTNEHNGFGGGIYFLTASPVTKITQSAIVGNSAKSGGGIFNWNTVNYNIFSTTFAKNTASDRGGGLHDGFASEVTLKNVTFAENTAPLGGNIGIKTNSVVHLLNSLVKGDEAVFCEESNLGGVNPGILDSLGHNLIENTGRCILQAEEGDQWGIEIQTESFTDNGSPGNARYPLPKGSEAIDAGDPAACINDLLTDQIGLARRGACDVGAVESACGDGLLQDTEGETCEDGNTADGDGCSAQCLLEGAAAPLCGNHIIELGEMCDDGNQDAGDGCSANCETENGEMPEPEPEEDDGNTPCSQTNVNEVCCGDSLLDEEAGETCDDGNEQDNDGCSSRCLNEPAASVIQADQPAQGGCSLLPL